MNENDSKSEVNLESLLQQLKGESPKNAETPQVSNDIKLNFKQTLSVISDDPREKIASNLFSNRTSEKEKSIENHLLNFCNNNDANSSKLRIVSDLFDSSMNSELKRNVVDDLFSTNREATVTNKDMTNRYIRPENVIEEGNDEKEIEFEKKSLNLIDMSNKVEIANSAPEEKSLSPIDVTKKSIDIDNEIFTKNNESKINKANDTSSNLFSVMLDDNKEKDTIIHMSKDINISSQNKIDDLRDKEILNHSLKDEEIPIKEENVSVAKIQDSSLKVSKAPYIREDSHMLNDDSKALFSNKNDERELVNDSIHDKTTVKNSIQVMKIGEKNSEKSLSIVINEEKSENNKITVTKSTKNDDAISSSYKLPKFKNKNNKAKNNTDIISNINIDNILKENYKELRPSATFTNKVNASVLLKPSQFDFSNFVIDEITYFDYATSMLSSISFRRGFVSQRRKSILSSMYCDVMLTKEISPVMKRAKDIAKYSTMIMENYFEVQETYSNMFDYISQSEKEKIYNALKRNLNTKFNFVEFNSIFCVTAEKSFDIFLVDNINGDSFYVAFTVSFLSSMIKENSKDKLFAVLLDAIRIVTINNDVVIDIAKCVTVINIVYDCVMINDDEAAIDIIHSAMTMNGEFRSMMIFYLRYVFTMYLSIYFGESYIDVIYEIFNEPNKNLFCLIPQIFDVNLNLFYVDEDNEMKMKNFTSNDTNANCVNVFFFYSSYHILTDKTENEEKIEKLSEFIRVKEKEKCKKCKNDQFLLYKNNLLCTECLLSTVTQIIKARTVSMFTDGFASREFTLRPISLSPSIHIRDIDLILHFQTSFNNIMQSSLNQMCFQCTHFSTDDSIIVLNCNCHFDIQCLKDMLISATDGKNVQNVFERNHQQSLLCLCGDVFNCDEALKRLIAKGVTFDADREKAKQRMIKYAIGYCMICKKCFLSEDENVDLSVDTNNKKLAYRFKVTMKAKKKEMTKGIDYIDTEHILCSSCYKRELQHETYIHMVNESGDREIHCAVCDKEHIISEKEFEGQIEKTCCAEKCIIF